MFAVLGPVRGFVQKGLLGLGLVSCLGLGVFVFVGAPAKARDVRPSQLSQVRIGGDQAETRIVFDLTAHSKPRFLSTSGTTVSELVLSFQGLELTSGATGKGRALLRAWSAREADGGTEVRLSFAKPVVIHRRFLLPPSGGSDTYRYVVDVMPEGAAQPVPPLIDAGQGLSTTAPIPANATEPQSLDSLMGSAPSPKKHQGKRIIVVDAGHGGKDPGTSGQHAHEKDLTLLAAKALKEQLQKTGRYKVVLTRDTDVFIPLDDRVKIARKANADLFLSLHADAGTEASLKGVSVYTLSEHGVDRAAKKVFSRGDWSMDLRGKDHTVNRILLDLTQRATTNRSGSFAENLLNRIDGQAPLLRRSHRSAGLYVLLAPDVPAVLMEMGFITNAQDEQRLKDPHERQKLMKATVSAIDDYFEGSTRFAQSPLARPNL